MIPIIKPVMDEDEVEATGRVIRSGWVTQGPEVAGFEQDFASEVKAEYACAVSSCTTALHLALLAVGIKPGDEVITVSHSFIATANSIRYCGAIPVFVDIQPETYNIDPALIEERVSWRTRAVLVVHQMGMPCDLEAILEIARRHNLLVIEDAACAIGSEIFWKGEWQRIGKPHGDIACFSFHPRKIITTGDGGMITTSNPEWNKKVHLLRQHGMSIPDTVRHGAREVLFESYPVLGYNYRMTDIQAAIGKEQLKKLSKIIARRRTLAAEYFRLMADSTGFGLPMEPSWARSNWQSFCIRLPERTDQKEIMQIMLDAGIATRRGIMCTHREEAYSGGDWSCNPVSKTCNCPPRTCSHLSQSEDAQDRTIILPLTHEMTVEEQKSVVQTLKEACKV